jgi:hypothetical protein
MNAVQQQDMTAMPEKEKDVVGAATASESKSTLEVDEQPIGVTRIEAMCKHPKAPRCSLLICSPDALLSKGWSKWFLWG